jgi:molybdenum cofactor cytidylyltransferase
VRASAEAEDTIAPTVRRTDDACDPAGCRARIPAGKPQGGVAAGDEAALAAAGRSGARVVLNRDPARGQTASLKAGLASGPAPSAPWLLHTVDHPLLLPEDVAALLAAFAAPHAIVLPVVGGRRGHPVLCGPPIAAEFLALGDEQPAHHVVRRDPARVLGIERSNPWLVADLDTPADLAAVRAELARREPKAAR